MQVQRQLQSWILIASNEVEGCWHLIGTCLMYAEWMNEWKSELTAAASVGNMTPQTLEPQDQSGCLRAHGKGGDLVSSDGKMKKQKL